MHNIADSASEQVPGAHSGRGEQTMRQLLEAAQKLFAEKGFRGTSIREIAREARSNVAAVNYHFGSKENLYREVFRRHKIVDRERGLAAVRDVMKRSAGAPTVESILRAFAHASDRRRGHGDARLFVRLVNRELAEPQVGGHFLWEAILEPLQRVLGDALAAACPGVPPRTLNMCIHSFLAQLAHLDQLQAHLAELGQEKVPMLDASDAIRHIVRFTSAGIKAPQDEEA